MITKERLQELIEQGATVYFAYEELNKVHLIDLGNPPQEIDFYGDLVQTKYEVGEHLEQNFVNIEDNLFAWELEDLYEHKEDAEWDLEFGKGSVARTEELNLKNWNELNECCKESDYYAIRFVTNSFNVDIQYLFSVNLKNNGSIYVCKEVDSGLSEVLFDKPFNEENYTEACRLIKKLFMVEE